MKGYTQTKPKKPGYFWVKECDCSTPIIVLIRDIHPAGMTALNVGDVSKFCPVTAFKWFQGPIKPKESWW